MQWNILAPALFQLDSGADQSGDLSLSLSFFRDILSLSLFRTYVYIYI